MRKVFVVARREYAAAVKTKAFIIGLLMMPAMMLISVVVQLFAEGMKDTRTKTFAVLDRSGALQPALQAAVDKYNAAVHDEKGKQIRPRFDLRWETPGTPDTASAQRFALSEEVRKGKLFGFLDIGPDVLTAPPGQESGAVLYHSNRPTFMTFSRVAGEAITGQVLDRRARSIQSGLSGEALRLAAAPVTPLPKGLYKRQPKTGQIEISDQSRFAGIFVPFGMIMLMFMVIMSGATPLMQGIVEEKMQRVAEVLLGSLSPFQLMMGKLLGMTGVSLTIGAVYLAGAFWAAHHFEWTEYITPELLFWFLIFQTLAVLMYGALFIAIGAACSDMKETQNLLGPVMIVICLPLFLTMNVIQEPNGPVATVMSFVPFATPMLMIARQAVPPGVDWWQPVLGAALVLLTTVFSVWVAGRIFRVGILMQGKGARLGEIMRWVLRG